MINQKGRFGIHGGQYIPETLMNAVIELEDAYEFYKNDPEFNQELNELLCEYASRPSRLYYAKRMTEDLGCSTLIVFSPPLPLRNFSISELLILTTTYH